jgi:hypothetical protein
MAFPPNYRNACSIVKKIESNEQIADRFQKASILFYTIFFRDKASKVLSGKAFGFIDQTTVLRLRNVP